MRKILAAALLASLLFSAGVAAVQKKNGLQIEGLFAGLEARGAPGAAVLVLADAKPLFQRGYGVTDLRSARPVNERTNFRLASVTKQFTAMAVMLLVHDGKLRYDTRLSEVFPDFPDYGKGITVRNLLNHTSGLPDYEDLMGDKYSPQVQIQDAEVLDLLKRATATKFTPGSRWEYSNSGYVLLGEIVTRVSGMPFAAFLRARIFIPLKMNGTVAYQKGKTEVRNRAFGHTFVRGTWRETDQSATSATLGDGGVYSSLTDLAAWNRGLRNHTLLSASEMSAWQIPVQVPDGSVIEPDGSPAAYGFGWFVNAYRGHARLWHYGESVGFRTAIQRFPAGNLTIIILCNRSDMNPTALALKIADAFFDH